MKKVSQLIEELQAYIAANGDAYVFCETPGPAVPGPVHRQSVMQNVAVFSAVKIIPGTTAWRDYCEVVNNA
jgi:hypothetical protein